MSPWPRCWVVWRPWQGPAQEQLRPERQGQVVHSKGSLKGVQVSRAGLAPPAQPLNRGLCSLSSRPLPGRASVSSSATRRHHKARGCFQSGMRTLSPMPGVEFWPRFSGEVEDQLAVKAVVLRRPEGAGGSARGTARSRGWRQEALCPPASPGGTGAPPPPGSRLPPPCVTSGRGLGEAAVTFMASLEVTHGHSCGFLVAAQSSPLFTPGREGQEVGIVGAVFQAGAETTSSGRRAHPGTPAASLLRDN